MKVALFGGSFNPPHRGHAWVIEHLLNLKAKNKQAHFDEIWLLPVARHAFHKKLWDFSLRLKLCEFLIADCAGETSRCRIEDIESTFSGENHTIDTLKALKERYPKTEFTLVLGSDLKDEIARWKNFPDIKKGADIYWIPRPGHEDPRADPAESPPVSSSAVREAIIKKRPGLLKVLLTPKVERFLRQQRKSRAFSISQKRIFRYD